MDQALSIDAGLLAIRLVAGLTLAAHGYQKLFAGGRIAGTGRWFESLGMRPGAVHAVLAATTEVAAGILLAVGLLTSLAGAAFVALMLVAAWTVHRTNGFFSVRNGWEYNLVLATIGVAVAICGPGRFSIDHVIGIDNDLNGLWGVLISAVGGVAAGSLQLLAFYRPEAAAKAATTSSV